MGKSALELINEFMIALSHLLWPVLVFIIIFIFKKQIIDILWRIKKGKLFGQEFELEEKIDKFQTIVKEAEQETPVTLSGNKMIRDDDIDILASSRNDPQIGIMLLSREIEKEIRILLASLGLLSEKNYVTIQQAFEILVQKGFLTKYTTGSVKTFWELRNRVIHGKTIQNESNIIRVLDIGIALLKTLRSIPHGIDIVYHPGVDIFSDASCTNKIIGAKGLILETIGPGGIEKTLRIFPTTKTNYIKGKRVAWEWNLSKTWGETWYIDPDTKEKRPAWSSSGEFIGRHIEEL